MSERYIRQIEFNSNVYLPDCPVVLEKGSVLLDSKTDTYVLQLKFANIGEIGASSIKVQVEALDDAGNSAYQEITAVYDEFSASGNSFGMKKLLPLSSNNAVMFNVYVVNVVSVDGLSRSFSREKYDTSVEMRDFVAEHREKVEQKQEQNAKMAALCWRSESYKLLLGAVGAILGLFTILFVGAFITDGFLPDSLWGILRIMMPPLRFWWRGNIVVTISNMLLFLFFWYMWISAWMSIGTPEIQKRTFTLAILSPVVYLVFDIVVALLLGTGFVFVNDVGSTIVFFVIFATPYLAVLFNVRKYSNYLG